MYSMAVKAGAASLVLSSLRQGYYSSRLCFVQPVFASVEGLAWAAHPPQSTAIRVCLVLLSDYSTMLVAEQPQGV